MGSGGYKPKIFGKEIRHLCSREERRRPANVEGMYLILIPGESLTTWTVTGMICVALSIVAFFKAPGRDK